MTKNDGNAVSKQPQHRYQLRHGRSRKSPSQSSAQVQLVPDSGTAASVTGAVLGSATNTLINGGQFTAAANVNRNVTININTVEGVVQTENCQPRQTANRGRNRRRGPLPQQYPTEPAQRSNEIYERHLRLKKRGHPLWIPQSNMALPIPYRARGVQIGDVGIFTENGGFDFLFNICVPRDDPINPLELPENFVPISPSVNPSHIRKFAEFSPGSYLASSSVAECRAGDQSSGLTFESSASEGAILTMPEGAFSEDLRNPSRFRKYIATHAEDWYKFLVSPGGCEVRNGDLHVVVGCDKTTSWGMATFANSSLSQDTNFRLKFSASEEQTLQRNGMNNYVWEHSGVAEVKVGPGRGENQELGETDSNRLRNQCLFLRTLNVTLSKNVWEELSLLSVVVADQNDSHDSGIGDPPSQSESPQNLSFKSRTSTDTLGSTSVPTYRLIDEEQSTGQILFETSSDTSRYEGCDLIEQPDVILMRSSSSNDVLHPSKIINQYLLEQNPHARVAVTHDKVWSGVVDSCHSDSSRMLSAVLSMNDIVLDNDNDLVFLELKENPGRLSREGELAELIKSIKAGRLTMDQYLFGSQGDRFFRLQYLCTALRSGSITQPISKPSFLTGHPQRPMSLDELLKICNGDFHFTELQSILSLRAELNLLPSEHADRPSCLLGLGDALSRRFYQWDQRDDLEEAIWSYQEALSLLPNSHYQYLETLLGLCSSIYQRYLLGDADDLQNLLRYLDLQYDLLNQQRSLLAPVEAQFKKLCQHSSLRGPDLFEDMMIPVHSASSADQQSTPGNWPFNASPPRSRGYASNQVFYPAGLPSYQPSSEFDGLSYSKPPVLKLERYPPQPASPCKRCVREGGFCKFHSIDQGPAFHSHPSDCPKEDIPVTHVQSNHQPSSEFQSRHTYSKPAVKADKPCTYCQKRRIRCYRSLESGDSCEQCVRTGSLCEYRSVGESPASSSRF